MSIKKYETLLKTVDLGSLTKASEELGYTQSAISQMIRSLEEELGVKLLIRDRAGVRLTEQGKYLVPRIRNVCEANNQVYACVASLQGSESRSLRVGVQAGTILSECPRLLQGFQSERPQVQFTLLQASAKELEAMMQDRHLDCAFVTGRTPQHKQVQSLVLRQEPLYAIFPQSETQPPSPYPLEELGNEVGFFHQDSLPEIVLQYLNKTPTLGSLQYHLSKSPTLGSLHYQGQDERSILSLVSAGFGMSILPERALIDVDEQVQIRPCTPTLHRSIFLLFPKNKDISPLTRDFIRYVLREEDNI